MAAYSAVLRGASRVYVVDRIPERLAAAEKINCIPVDFSKGDAVEQIIKLNDGEVDRSVDAVGYQAVGKGGKAEEPNIVLENMIKVTRACGGLGIPGLYVPRYERTCNDILTRHANNIVCTVTLELPTQQLPKE